jgi:hypothetical protein
MTGGGDAKPGEPSRRAGVRCGALACVVAGAALAMLVGCDREAADERPERVVEEFIARMQRVHGEQGAAREAYELLWSEAQANLAERAKRATAVSGRKIAPEEMLVPSRFAPKFKPRHYAAQVEGQWAVVTVEGEGPTPPQRQVKCVLEEGHWRVVLELPALPPIQKRSDAG